MFKSGEQRQVGSEFLFCCFSSFVFVPEEFDVSDGGTKCRCLFLDQLLIVLFEVSKSQ